jgi:hypothetical protein
MSALEIAMNALIRISHGVDHPDDIATNALRHIQTMPHHLKEIEGLLPPELTNWHPDHSD